MCTVNDVYNCSIVHVGSVTNVASYIKKHEFIETRKKHEFIFKDEQNETSLTVVTISFTQERSSDN